MVFVIVPAQHEIADEATCVAQLDRDVQKVVNLRGVVQMDAFFERFESLFPGARDTVEIAIDGLVLEKYREIVEVTTFKGSQHEALSEDGLKELNHVTVLMVLH
jgi:hypothetical protein